MSPHSAEGVARLRRQLDRVRKVHDEMQETWLRVYEDPAADYWERLEARTNLTATTALLSCQEIALLIDGRTLR